MVERVPVILKPPHPEPPPPAMIDYAQAYARFSWERAAQAMDGLPGGRGLNIAHEAVDRHLRAGRGATVAIRWLGKQARMELTYAALAGLTNRFANVLAALGVRPGEAVFSLLGRIPALYVTALGTLKHRSVFCPLFSAFGPEPIRTRLALGEGTVLVTTLELYQRKVSPVRASLPALRHILLVHPTGRPSRGLPPGTLDLDALLDRASPELSIAPTDAEVPALLHFTSGTTGRPKGALHVHRAVVAHHATGALALDLRAGDVFWCTADPGWVTGTSYGIISPLTHGATLVVDEQDFDAERWYRTLERERVTVWYTAPTAVRMLMAQDEALPRRFDLSTLRHVASVGEPLNPEAVVWSAHALGRPIHDNWWQTETGGIMVSNFRAMEIRPGSMGRPVPGITAGIVRRREDGSVEELPPGEQGELALRRGWPSMFRGYLHEEERYRRCFADGWYLSGDLARQDADGYFWFVGRGDDVIKSSGHLIGPFEVESALMEHPAVAEAAVIGKPDPIAGELVKAFVVLRPAQRPSERLRSELIALARKRLGPAVAPRELSFAEQLPRTRSGKILRRLLRARELGLPEGDTSTLETPAPPPPPTVEDQPGAPP